MSQTAQIYELVSTTGKSAPNMTNALKSIGNGNMQDGIKSMADFFWGSGSLYGKKIGERNGWIKGSLTTIITGAVVWGGVQLKRRCEENRFRKSLQENGDRILKAMKENVSQNDDVTTEEIAIEE